MMMADYIISVFRKYQLSATLLRTLLYRVNTLRIKNLQFDGIKNLRK
jgi:hypothetical protein